jgi:hypothetical protein
MNYSTGDSKNEIEINLVVELKQILARISFTNVKHIHDLYHFFQQYTNNESKNEKSININLFS